MLNIRIYSEKIENPIIQASILLHYPSLFVYLFLLMLFLFYFVFGGRLCID